MTGRSPKAIVLVDDDRSVLAAFQAILSTHGFHVVTWNSFESAKHYIEQHPPDVLITDVRLGAFNGLQLAILVKARRPDARVLVISGFEDPVLRAEAQRCGAAFRLKPISGRELIEFVDEQQRADIRP